MTPAQLMKDISSGRVSGVRIGHRIRTGPADARAADILCWCSEKWPDITQGELDDALLSALWWSMTFAAVEDTDTPAPDGETGGGDAE